MSGTTTLEHVSDERVINFLQIIHTETPDCKLHFSICLYLNCQRPQMTPSGDSNWPHGILRNESFHVPENQIQWEPVLQLILRPLERERILWSRDTAVTEYGSPTFYPKLSGAFKVGDIATLIHNKHLESELAWEGRCKCRGFV
jgi:hypothetical protein